MEIFTYVASTALVTWAMLDQVGFFERHPVVPALWLGSARTAGNVARAFGDVALWAERNYYQAVRR